MPTHICRGKPPERTVAKVDFEQMGDVPRDPRDAWNPSDSGMQSLSALFRGRESLVIFPLQGEQTVPPDVPMPPCI